MKTYLLSSILLLLMVLAVACQSQSENDPYLVTQGQEVNITDLPKGNFHDDRIMSPPNISQEDIDTTKEFFDSGNEDEIRSYCQDNQMSCVFYCHDDQDNEFCQELVPERPIPEELK